MEYMSPGSMDVQRRWPCTGVLQYCTSSEYTCKPVYILEYRYEDTYKGYWRPQCWRLPVASTNLPGNICRPMDTGTVLHAPTTGVWILVRDSVFIISTTRVGVKKLVVAIPWMDSLN